MTQDIGDELKRRLAAFDDSWLSVKQAATHAGVCERTIRRAYLSRQGSLHARRSGSALPSRMD
jgi:hypothetical protein